MKLSYTGDASPGESLFEMLDLVFPGLHGGIKEMPRLGASWISVSTPFVHFENGAPVSHVGLIELPLILEGKTVTVGSVHAVATHPDHRRRGYYGQLMREVIEDTKGRLETLILTTENPEYYEPFGFRGVTEYEFSMESRQPGSSVFQILELSNPADLALIHHLLETREPVSNLVGVQSERTVFLFSEAQKPIHYFAELDVAICLELNAGTMEIFDIVGSTIPPAAAFLPFLPGPFERVLFHFSPDRLAVRTASRPRVMDLDGPSCLMARGPFPETTPFTLPRTGRT